MKLEVKEIKKEEESKILTETQVKADTLAPVKVKRESDDAEKLLIAVEQVAAKRPVKRRRKA